MQGLMKFHQGLLKILRKQNVTDELMDGRTDGQRENSIPSHKHSLRGGIITKFDTIMGRSPQCYVPSFVEIGTPVLVKKHFEEFSPYMGMVTILAM